MPCPDPFLPPPAVPPYAETQQYVRNVTALYQPIQDALGADAKTPWKPLSGGQGVLARRREGPPGGRAALRSSRRPFRR